MKNMIKTSLGRISSATSALLAGLALIGVILASNQHVLAEDERVNCEGEHNLGKDRCFKVSGKYIYIRNPADGQSYSVLLPEAKKDMKMTGAQPSEDGQSIQIVYKTKEGKYEFGDPISVAKAVSKSTAQGAPADADKTAADQNNIYHNGANPNTVSPVSPTISDPDCLHCAATLDTKRSGGDAVAKPTPNAPATMASAGNGGSSRGFDWGKHLKWGTGGLTVASLLYYGLGAFGVTGSVLSVGIPLLAGVAGFALIYGLGASGILGALWKGSAKVRAIVMLGLIGGALGSVIALAAGSSIIGGFLTGGLIGLAVGAFFGLLGLLS